MGTFTTPNPDSPKGRIDKFSINIWDVNGVAYCHGERDGRQGWGSYEPNLARRMIKERKNYPNVPLVLYGHAEQMIADAMLVVNLAMILAPLRELLTQQLIPPN